MNQLKICDWNTLTHLWLIVSVCVCVSVYLGLSDLFIGGLPVAEMLFDLLLL